MINTPETTITTPLDSIVINKNINSVKLNTGNRITLEVYAYSFVFVIIVMIGFVGTLHVIRDSGNSGDVDFANIKEGFFTPTNKRFQYKTESFVDDNMTRCEDTSNEDL